MSIQQIKKLCDKECYFCGEKEYTLLDAHRIKEGSQGGKYEWWNILVLCSNCHRRIHSELIKILGKYKCSNGTYVIHYIEDGKEKFK